MESFSVNQRMESRETIFKTSTSLEDFSQLVGMPKVAIGLRPRTYSCPAHWSVVTADLFRAWFYFSWAFWLCGHHRHLSLLPRSRIGFLIRYFVDCCRGTEQVIPRHTSMGCGLFCTEGCWNPAGPRETFTTPLKITFLCPIYRAGQTSYYWISVLIVLWITLLPPGASDLLPHLLAQNVIDTSFYISVSEPAMCGGFPYVCM